MTIHPTYPTLFDFTPYDSPTSPFLLGINLIRTFYTFCFGFGCLCSLTYCTSPKSMAGDTIPTNVPGGKITFMSTRDGNFELYTMDAGGNHPTNLTRSNKTDYWASFSPSGATIHFYL